MLYPEAFREACAAALRLTIDVGIEPSPYDGPGHFRTFLLPAPKHRAGHELRCEVVTPELARACGPVRR